MVSKASELFPDPLSPVITVKVLRGISTLMFFRLCWRAPCTEMRFNMLRLSPLSFTLKLPPIDSNSTDTKQNLCDAFKGFDVYYRSTCADVVTCRGRRW